MVRSSGSWSAVRKLLARCKSGAAAFPVSFVPFGVRVGVRVRVKVRSWVYACTLIPLGSTS